MSFTQNDWGQRDIIKKFIILNKWSKKTIHAVLPKKYQKYLSTTILKNENVLAKVNKLPWGSLLHMTPHDSYSITIHVRTMATLDIRN